MCGILFEYTACLTFLSHQPFHIEVLGMVFEFVVGILEAKILRECVDGSVKGWVYRDSVG